MEELKSISYDNLRKLVYAIKNLNDQTDSFDENIICLKKAILDYLDDLVGFGSVSWFTEETKCGEIRYVGIPLFRKLCGVCGG